MVGKLEELKRDASITVNGLLDDIDIEKARIIEIEAKKDSYIASQLAEIEKALEGINIAHSEKWNRVYSLYSEAMVYLELHSRIAIERRAERAKEQKKTSDFYITFEGKVVYAEYKALMRAGGDLNYRDMNLRGLENALYVEERTEAGDQTIITEFVHQPFKKDDRNYDPYSIRQKTEILIDKLEQNYKSEQYEDGETIAIVDLAQLYKTDMLKYAIVPAFYDNAKKCIVSGFVWNALFGREGTTIFRYPDFPGASNFDGYLSKDGFLVKHSNVMAVLFRTADLSGQSYYAGISNDGCDEATRRMLYRVSSAINDHKNEGFYLLYR